MGLFISGILLVAIGFYLASEGLTSGETGLVVSTGNLVAGLPNETADSSEVNGVITETKNNFLAIGVVAFLIGLLELIGVSVVLIKQ